MVKQPYTVGIAELRMSSLLIGRVPRVRVAIPRRKKTMFWVAVIGHMVVKVLRWTLGSLLLFWQLGLPAVAIVWLVVDIICSLLGVDR